MGNQNDTPNRGKLPAVNVEFATSQSASGPTPEQIRGKICNPIYSGVGPFPPLMDEATWVKAAAWMIEEDGAEQFLVNMLYVLRKSFDSVQ